MRRVRLQVRPDEAEITLRVRDEPEPHDQHDPSQRVPLLCLHGAGMSSVVWMDVVRRLSPQRRVVAPDLPGHGQSARGCAVSIDWYRDTVVALRERLGMSRVAVMGHSMGAAIALKLALSLPERVAGLILLNGAGRLRVSKEVLDLLQKVLPAPPGFADRMPGDLADLMFSPTTDADLRARWQAMLLSAPTEVVLQDFRACDGFDVRPELPRLRLPVLLLAGEDDLMVPPRLSQEVAGLCPGAQVQIVPGTGHLSHIEQPDLCQEYMSAFLRTLS